MKRSWKTIVAACVLFVLIACAHSTANLKKMNESYFTLQEEMAKARQAGAVSDAQWAKFDELSDQIDAQFNEVNSLYAQVVGIQDVVEKQHVQQQLDEAIKKLQGLLAKLKEIR